MSKNDFILEASPRSDVGKGASRRLRRVAGEIPAIIYGAGKEPTAITIPHKDIMKALENEAFFSHIITVKVDGKDESVVIKDLQRHPAKPRIMHADFLRVSADQAINVRVPLHFVNEDKCPGVKEEGGIINHLMNDLEITCLPGDLPEFINVFMAQLTVGDAIHISDLALPEGVTSVDLSHGDEHDQTVAACVMPKVEVEPGPEEGEGVEGEEGEEGEEGVDGTEGAEGAEGGDSAASSESSDGDKAEE
jgi:large subunit ribosomal protein L25